MPEVAPASARPGGGSTGPKFLGDGANWSRLLAAIQAVDHGWQYLTEQVLAEEFGHPDCHFERGSVGVFDGGTMVAAGRLVTRQAAGAVDEMRYYGGVHPDWRGRGIGAAALYGAR